MTKDNFYLASKARFKSCNRPDREPDFVSGSSEYWYTENGVYRRSDHWSDVFGEIRFICDENIIRDNVYYGKLTRCKRVSSCYWTLEITPGSVAELERQFYRIKITGFCPWTKFKKNNVRKHKYNKYNKEAK